MRRTLNAMAGVGAIVAGALVFFAFWPPLKLLPKPVQVWINRVVTGHELPPGLSYPEPGIMINVLYDEPAFWKYLMLHLGSCLVASRAVFMLTWASVRMIRSRMS
jgi:hypothetical protein